MNKNSYRIIYSKARQMFVAVAENVRSQTKTSGQSEASTQNNINNTESQAFHQLWQVKALVASISLWMPLAPVYADIVADSAANAANRAVIGAGKNSAGTVVPVVNIQTPKNGISHNIYKQFDVLAEGAVLNNSRQGATTQTVGNVAANPFLATGEARVILNEVNSSAASRFEGNLEVAGQMADVIIANPSGISIKGGGFINANKAIFTTGKPQLNADGSIKQFTVDQGKITVSANPNSKFGLGGNNNDANYVDLYARALELSAELRAKNDIQVIAGANNVSADLQDVTAKTGTGTAPTLAVDVKALGGMYANNIYLMGTEKGLGVTNAGTIQAVNNLVVTSAGKIEHSGTISSTSKTQGLVNIQTTGTGAAADINSSGSINSNSMLNIDSGNNLNVNAKEIIINIGSLASSPLIVNTKGNINLAADTRIMDDSQGGDVYIDAANINLAAGSELKSNRGTASIQVQKDLVAAKGAKLIAAQDLNVLSNGKLSLTENHIQASLGSINLQANSANTQNIIDLQGGTIYAGKDLNLYSSGDLNLKNLGFSLENSVTRSKNLTAYSGRNLVWDSTARALPQVNGDIKVEAANLIDLKGSGLSSTGDLKLQAKALNIGTDLNTGKNLSLNATQSDLNLNRTLTAQNNIDVTSLDGKITATGLNATSVQGKLSILAAKDTLFTNAGTTKTVLKGVQGVTIGTTGIGDLTVQNAILESQNGNIVATSGAKNTLTDSTLTAKNNIEIFATDDLTLDGVKSTSQQHTALHSKKNVYINSHVNSYGVADFSSTKSSELNSTGVLSLVGGGGLNVQNTKLTGGAVLIEGEVLSALKAVDLNATGSDLLKNDAKLNNLNGDLSIQTNSSLFIDPKIHSLKAVGDIELIVKDGNLILSGYEGTAGNGSEQVVNLDTSNGGINLEGKKVEIQGSQLTAQKDIKITSSGDNLLIDGVRNNIKESISLKHKQEFNDELYSLNDSLAKEQSELINKPRYNEYKLELDKIVNKRKKAEDMIKYSMTKPLGIRLLNETIKMQDALEEKYPEINGPSRKLKALIAEVEAKINYFNNTVNGSEHTESNLISKTGNINISSALGLSITGANISGQSGQVNLEANGILSQPYSPATTIGASTQPKIFNASIVIDGHSDFYDKGNENDQNYSMRTLVSPTIINGDKGVNIRTVGKSKSDNLVLQATGITSKNGDVKIESNKNILFDVAIEQSYDRSTTTEKKKSWGGLKKKYITTVAESNSANAASVDISGKNIFIETKKLDPSLNTPDNNIDIYSGRFTAEGGQIKINSGGNLNFYTVEESSSSNVDITKKSSFAGIKYNTSKTNATRTQVSELPATLKADYIGTKSGFDTRLVGTEFEYLKGASIEAGGKLDLIAAKTSITDLVKKEKNSVVWQSMQDKGSITETAQLPSFNGPVLPTFKAAGGLSVQVPISEKDANKIELRNAILELSKQPGNEYLKEFVNRKDIDWQMVLLTQKDWDYKQQGLTGAGAAIIAIVVTMVTAGAGAAVVGALGGSAATLGGSAIAMTQAALTSLATQASVSLINNGGNIGKTLKELGSKDSVKNLAASVVTAGLLSQVSTALNLKLDSTALSDRSIRLINNFTTSIGSTLVQTAIKGGDLEENLKVALLSGLAGALQGELASQIKDLENINYMAHKIAHAIVGCAAGAIQGQCEAGAIGGAVGEIVAGFTPPSSGLLYTEEEKQKILIVGQLTSGIIAAYAGYDVNVASNSANIALTNNAFNEKKVKELLDQAKGYMGEKGGQALDAVSRGIAKGDINALKNAQTQIAEYLLKKADSGGLSQAEIVTFGTLYALNETLFPTNILDVIPGVGKAAGKGNDLLKGIRATAPASAASATARLGLREDLAKLANIPRNMEIQPANIWGKTIQDIKYSFEMDGAVLTLVPPKSSTSGLAQVYSVKNSATGIKEFEYHPGGGTHSSDGVRYYKIVMNDGTQFRIIDPNKAFKPGTITSNQIYLNPNGQKLKYENGKWEIWK